MKIRSPWEQRSPRSGIDDQALPLINVAFLLLVFFLMAGTHVVPEPFALAHLQLQQGETTDRSVQLLSVARDGRLAYRGELVEQSELTPDLFDDLHGPLLIRVDARTAAQRVIDLLRHLARLGIVSVRLVGVNPKSP